MLPGKAWNKKQSNKRKEGKASMRPRHCCRGRREQWLEQEHHLRRASMRPRHCCRGRLGKRVQLIIFHRRFNEAPALLPGKAQARDVLRDRAEDTNASMRPRHCCRGRQRISIVEQHPHFGKTFSSGCRSGLRRSRRVHDAALASVAPTPSRTMSNSAASAGTVRRAATALARPRRTSSARRQSTRSPARDRRPKRVCRGFRRAAGSPPPARDRG